MPSIWRRFLGDVIDGRLRLRDQDSFLAFAKTHDAKTLELAVRVAKKDRTLPQNSLLHVLAHEIAEETGEHLDKVKAEALVAVLGLEGLTKTTVLGRELYFARSTATLSREEFSKVIDWLQDKAQWLSVRVPAPEDIEVM